MRFDREPWRKLYAAESVTHRMLPLFTRGLRDYLLRHAEDDGTILRNSDDHAADLSRVLCATAQERKQIETAIEDLYNVGYLASKDGRLWIVKFSEAQSPRSPGAKRQAKYARTLPTDADAETDGLNDALTDAPPDADGVSPPDDPPDSTLEEKRREENKSIREVFGCWRDVHEHPNAKLDVKRSSRIRARLREGFTAEQLKIAIKNAKNEPWLMGENPNGKVYDGLETLLRDAAQVERLIELGGGKAAVIEIR